MQLPVERKMQMKHTTESKEEAEKETNDKEKNGSRTPKPGTVYHVSDTSGIRVLQPRVSTHQKPYVYAIDNLVTGLLFGVRKDDFDFRISTDEEDRPIVYECYPDAFRQKYEGRSCSIYELSEEGFVRGTTSWTPELVSERETLVLRETAVPDLYTRLLEEEKQGNLVLQRYQDTSEYKELISRHIVDRLVRFHVLDGDWEQDSRFATYFRPFIEGLLALMDGHLL